MHSNVGRSYLVLLLEVMVLWRIQEGGYGERMVLGRGGTAKLDEEGVGITHF